MNTTVVKEVKDRNAGGSELYIVHLSDWFAVTATQKSDVTLARPHYIGPRTPAFPGTESWEKGGRVHVQTHRRGRNVHGCLASSCLCSFVCANHSSSALLWLKGRQIPLSLHSSVFLFGAFPL